LSFAIRKAPEKAGGAQPSLRGTIPKKLSDFVDSGPDDEEQSGAAYRSFELPE